MTLMQRQEFLLTGSDLKRYYKYRKHITMAGGCFTHLIITFLEIYGRMWDKCASNVPSIVCRTHLSHFQFVANMSVYKHISHTSWDKCAPSQICSYKALNIYNRQNYIRYKNDSQRWYCDNENHTKIIVYHL
jgi:hypothetical protein